MAITDLIAVSIGFAVTIALTVAGVAWVTTSRMGACRLAASHPWACVLVVWFGGSAAIAIFVVGFPAPVVALVMALAMLLAMMVCLTQGLRTLWYRSIPRAAGAFAVVALIAWQSISVGRLAQTPAYLTEMGFLVWWVGSAVGASYFVPRPSRADDVSICR